jgi:hypothetical protein
MSRPDWVSELESLALKFPQAGVSSDLAALTLAEAWGALQFLRRFAETYGSQ